MLHAVLTVTVCIVASHLALAQICRKQNQTVTPQFTDVLARMDMVRWGRSIAVRCCAEGYDDITWYRKEGSDWVHFPPTDKGSSLTPTVEEHRQILRINKADMADNTSFRCDLLKDGLSMKQHQMKLIVQRCDELSRGPIPTWPFPENKMIKNFGENVTLSCTGYFGCGSNELRLAKWSVEPKKLRTDVSKRHVTHQYSRNDMTTIGTNLTIYNVQPEDLKLTFVCMLSNSQMNHGTVLQKVHISREAIPAIPWKTIIPVIAGVASGLLVLIILSVIVKYFYGPQVALFVNSRLPRFKPAPERGEKEFNALIYHAEGDESTATDIKDKLQKKGYKIFISDDLGRNQPFGDYEKISDQSLLIMFLHSKNLQEDQFAHLLLLSLIDRKRAQDIVFLVVDEYDPKEVMESTAHAIHREQNGNVRIDTECEGQRDMVNLTPNRANLEGLENNESNANSLTTDESTEDGENDASQNTNVPSKDLSFWKALPRYHVPAENASVRKKKNFLCWLQNKIPKFQDQLKKPVTDKSKGRTPSGRRLLTSQDEESFIPTNSGAVIEDDNVFLEGQRETVPSMQNEVLNNCLRETDNNIDNPRQSHMHLENEVPYIPQIGQTEDVTVAVVHAIGDQTNLKSVRTTEVPDNLEIPRLEEAESQNIHNESSLLLASDPYPIHDNFILSSPIGMQGSLVSNISESSGIGSSASGVGSFSRSESHPYQGQNMAVNQNWDISEEYKTQNGNLGRNHKLSLRQSSGESGYDTPLDQKFSP